MTVSIIIAVKTWAKNLEECVGKCLELDYPDFEIIILPDSERGTVPGPATDRDSPRQSNNETINREPSLNTQGAVTVRVIPTGAVSPAKKRDMAVGYAKGDILAFIDDDAYPAPDWLKNAVENFKDEDVAAVGGPAITPAEDALRQKASGIIYASSLVSGNYIYRYIPKEKRAVDDYPSCNFLVRKSIIRELEGFNTNFWPGEDTKFCLDITKKLGRKIIYDPRALVYHHRRPLFLPHLRQVASYALHRGYFVKRYPQTSRKFAYFLPSLFLLALAGGGVLSIFSFPFSIIYSLCVSIYLFIILIFSFSKGVRLASLVLPGILLTHLAYGFYFLKGFLSPRLKEEL